MTQKRLLLGDEAIALGALHAGLSGVYAYPGTPSTEITEFIQGDALARERRVRSRWCTNEKTAMEAALGMSYAGKRALVCMKHVGMNVCADAFVNAGITGVKGGLVVVAADEREETLRKRGGRSFVCGFAGPMRRTPDGRGWFAGIGIHPDYRRLGLGSTLFAALCEGLGSLGADYMTLFTNTDGAAHRIYEAAGFEARQTISAMECDLSRGL